MTNKKEIITNANSKGFIPDYYGAKNFGRLGIFSEGRTPEFNTDKALNIIKNDPTVKAGLTTLVDKVLETQWGLFTKNKKDTKKETELRKKRFNKVLRKSLFNLFLYNNSFIEIILKGKDLSDLNVLESTLMKIDAKDNGDIRGYYQEVGGDKDQPQWKPDKVTHIKFREITNNVWAEPLDLQSLYETVLIKDYIRQWLAWFFGTNQMRGLYVVENGASEAKLKDFVSFLKASEKDRTKPVILQGKVMYQMLNSFKNEGESILKVLEWCDNQILMLLQVPPIAIGQPDSSGRSNSVEQFQSLNTTVLNVQRILEDDLTYDLFPKIGFTDTEFRFGVLDESARKTAFEMAEIMKNMMMTDDAIKEFFQSQGIVFETSKLFKDPMEMANLTNKDVKQGSEGMIGNAGQGEAPSRKGQGNKQLSEANQKEMVKNAEDVKFNNYPYKYEVEENAD